MNTAYENKTFVNLFGRDKITSLKKIISFVVEPQAVAVSPYGWLSRLDDCDWLAYSRLNDGDVSQGGLANALSLIIHICWRHH